MTRPSCLLCLVALQHIAGAPISARRLQKPEVASTKPDAGPWDWSAWTGGWGTGDKDPSWGTGDKETTKPDTGDKPDATKPGTSDDVTKPDTSDKPDAKPSEPISVDYCLSSAREAGLSEEGSSQLLTLLTTGVDKPGGSDKPGGTDKPGTGGEGGGGGGGGCSGSACVGKILALHGGGGDGSSMSYALVSLMRALPDFEFVFATAPDDGLWMRDPPGGKEQPTTDPNWDANSLAYLDRLVATQGPFDAIIGYSQGGAYVPAYLSHVPPATFRAAMMFCGYLPSTHRGIMGRIEAASPFSTPAFAFAGARDATITNGMSREAADKFTSVTWRVSPQAGHHLPEPSDPAFGEAVAFLRALAPGGGSGSGSGSGSSGGDKPGTGGGDKPGTGDGDKPGTGDGDKPGTGDGDKPGSGGGDKPGTGDKYAIPAAGVAIINGGVRNPSQLYCLKPADAELTSLPPSVRYGGRRPIAPQCCGKGNGKCYREVDGSCIAGRSSARAPHITAFTYSQAAEYCDRKGLELCQKTCRNTGCNYNAHPVYSSLPCDGKMRSLNEAAGGEEDAPYDDEVSYGA